MIQVMDHKWICVLPWVNKRIAHGLAGAIFLLDVMKYNIQNGFYEYHQLNQNQFY